jgi:lytic murein transglycosylase
MPLRRIEGRMIRTAPRRLLAAAMLIVAAIGAPARAAPDPAFTAFLQSLWPEARERGISRATFDNAVRGLEPDLSLPDLEIPGRVQKPPGQPEFVQTPADYLKEASLARLAAQGRKLHAQYHDVFARIEKEFGVPGPIVLAIWGRESDYSTHYGGRDVLQMVGTQAFTGRRKDYFRDQFLWALKMLQDGIPRSEMRSSWGGAMGLTQFLPSEFYKYGVDFDGDGKVDIWRSVPDALASAAKQLVGEGWERDKPWAYEVRLPADVDCTIADPDKKMPLSEWLKRGFALANGRKAPARDLAEPASLLLPAGTHGPGFLIFHNYFALKEYNFSDLYVLFVGNVSDRIAGGGPFETAWQPVVQLRTAQLEEMQKRLTALGLYGDKLDGKAGMKTRLALGAYQKKNGLTLDCWPTAAVLDHMRAAKR